MLLRVVDLHLGAAMVRDGWALAFVRYVAAYVEVEEQTQSTARGLLQGTTRAPLEWQARARHWMTALLPFACSRYLHGK